MYGVEKYIERCLMSLTNQDISSDDYEIIAVNDGSPDRSADIAKEIAAKHSNIRVIDQNNQGLSMARNNGMDVAKGEYIWFVDSDDWIANNCLSRILSSLNTYEPDLLQLQYENVYDDPCKNNKPKEFIIDGVKSGSYVTRIGGLPAPAQFTIYRHSFLKNNELCFVKGIYHEDSEFKPRATYLASRIASLDGAIYKYYQRAEGSITSNFKLKNGLDMFVVMNNLLMFAQTQVTENYRKYIYSKIGLTMNSLLSGMQELPYNERSIVLSKLNASQKIFKAMSVSSMIKYRLEGLVLYTNASLGLWLYKWLK